MMRDVFDDRLFEEKVWDEVKIYVVTVVILACMFFAGKLVNDLIEGLI